MNLNELKYKSFNELMDIAQILDLESLRARKQELI
ncbi:Rho termination factor N-terminal domain-containing protein, partial [Francisella tularensis]